MSDALKDELLELIVAMWRSNDTKLTNSDRTRALRPEILARLLTSVMTDDERAMANGLPTGCRMRENSKVIARENLDCGEHVWIGEGAIVDASGGLEIGAHTTIGSGSYIWSHSSAMANILMDNRPGNPYIARARTRIGRGCFIGGPSVIYAGVSVGNGCLIMPMSVVSTDVADNAMVGGAPAKFIKNIDQSYIDRFTDSLKQTGR